MARLLALNSHLTMISNEYFTGIPYNRELADVIGVDYSNDRDEVRINPMQVNISNEVFSVMSPHECVSNGQCERCSQNIDYDVEYLQLETRKGIFTFERKKSHQLGGIWSNWYEVTPTN